MKFKNLLTSFILFTSLNTYAEYKTLFSTHFTPQSKFVGQIGERCTFTMLSPGIAITAQHCVDDTDSIDVFFNRGRTSDHHVEGEHFVEKVHQIKGKDIAVVEVYPRYERELSDFPALSRTNTSKLQDKSSNIIFWGYPGSLGSQLAEIEGPVLHKRYSVPSRDFFRYNAVTEGGTSGSSVRLKNDPNTIIGIHVAGRKEDRECALGWVPECGRALTFNQKEIDDIYELIAENEALNILEKIKNASGNQTCDQPKEDIFLGECDPSDYSQVEIQHIEEPSLETFYIYEYDYLTGQSFQR